MKNEPSFFISLIITGQNEIKETLFNGSALKETESKVVYNYNEWMLEYELIYLSYILDR